MFFIFPDDHTRNSNVTDTGNESFPQKTVTIIEKPSKTIKQLHSPYSSLAFTPISSSDIFVSSSGSENIFTIIDKTFTETSDHEVQLDTPKSICTECHVIKKELEDNVEKHKTEMKLDTKKPNESDVVEIDTENLDSSVTVESASQEIQKSSAQDESVWQVEDIKNYNSSKINSEEPQAAAATHTEIDSTSFIVLRDDENLLLKNAKREDVLPNSRDRCVDCCFCNPDLHRRDGASSATSCNFCNKQKTSPNARETESKSTNTGRVYESLSSVLYSESKSDHTHIRTKSKESDTVSLKCTRTNSRIRRFIPEDTLNGNVCDDNEDKSNQNRSKKPPKPPIISPVRKINTESASPSHKNKTTSGIRLPSPFVTGISSHSHDSTSSQCSSSSCSPCSPKKCPVLPTGRWQNSGVQKQLNKTRASRYKEFYGENDKKQVANKNDGVSSPSLNTGKMMLTFLDPYYSVGT